MLVRLPDVLDLPSFRAAQARVLCGDVESAMVRWVHSSEVYEMGSLLAGGEVLLTSGLGLHGRSAEQLAAYVDLVADAGGVGIAMELGRSFFEMPAAMVDAARRRGVVLIEFTTVVPFERMVEDFHDLLVSRKLGAARYGEPLWRDFLAVVVAGEGVRALLDAISRAAGCVVELHNPDGRLVERSRISSVASETEQVAAEVRTGAGPAGTLVLRGRPTRRRTAVAERGAVALSLELARHPGAGQRPSLAQALVSDLAGGALSSGGDVARRLSELGWNRSPGQPVVAIAVDADRRTTLADLVPRIEEVVGAAVGRPALAGVVGGDVVVLAPGVAHPLQLRGRLEETVAGLGSGAGPDALVGAAPPVDDLADLADAVAQARGVLRSARRVGIRSGALLARDLGVQRLLGGADTTVVGGFVAEQIGALIEEDRTRSADLVRTLDAFLACRLSKATTARQLGIRRQSLYARLTRIESVLGVSLDDPTHVAGLSLALTAWRMRTGLDPQSVFERSPRTGRRT
jgi:purine catabolism regulator